MSWGLCFTFVFSYITYDSFPPEPPCDLFHERNMPVVLFMILRSNAERQIKDLRIFLKNCKPECSPVEVILTCHVSPFVMNSPLSVRGFVNVRKTAV